MKYRGLAVRNKNIIYLNPIISLEDSGCQTGTVFYQPCKKIKFKEGEQYFRTLLHEIGHFKLKKEKPLKKWVKLKRELFREAKEDLKARKIGDKKFGKKPMTKREEREFIENLVWYNSELPREKGERSAHYLARIESFKSWLIGDRVDEHISVEDWARREFKKQRKRIRLLIQNLN